MITYYDSSFVSFIHSFIDEKEEEETSLKRTTPPIVLGAPGTTVLGVEAE